MKKEEEEKLTFKPTLIAKHSSPARVFSQVTNVAKKKPKVYNEDQCTFVPKINPIKQSFKGVSLYLNQDAFERLSRPKTPSQSRLSHRESHSANTSRVSSRNSRRSDSPEKNVRESFESFLARQQDSLKRKEEKIERVKATMENPHQPNINPKSKEMMSKRRKGAPFLERMMYEEKKKESKVVQPSSIEKECTFKPKINKVSQKLPPRSIGDLAYGDKERRRLRLMEKKTKYEQKQMQNVTFQPKLISKSINNVESTLKISSDPSNYLARVAEIKRRHEAKRNAILEERKKKELNDCTFKPKVNDAPEYIKQIARTYALVRGPREAKPSPKPQWKYQDFAKKNVNL